MSSWARKKITPTLQRALRCAGVMWCVAAAVMTHTASTNATKRNIFEHYDPKPVYVRSGRITQAAVGPGAEEGRGDRVVERWRLK